MPGTQMSPRLKAKADPIAAGSVKEPGLTTAATAAEVDKRSPFDQGVGGEIGPAGVQADPVVFSETTPSGLVVEYQPEQPELKIKREYRVDGKAVPSVTTVLNVIAKDLSSWGQRIGVEGVLELIERGVLRLDDGRLRDDCGGLVDAEDIKKFLKEEKLSAYYVTKGAQDRGTSVHKAFENWARTGIKPFVADFEERDVPYVDGLNLFLKDFQGAEPLAVEVMVASKRHKFAGRYDLFVRIPEETRLAVRCYPKWESKHEEIPAGKYRLDLKTSSGVWPSYHLQLDGYEIGALESGYEPADYSAILRVTDNGKYEFVVGRARPGGFLAARKLFDVMQELK